MIIKEHKNNEGKLILAICDKELLNKIIEENDLQLDLTSNFYKGEEKSEEEIKILIKKSYLINAVGEKTIEFLKKLELTKDEEIKKIKNTPYAQIITELEPSA